MPRALYSTEPKVINTLQPRHADLPYLEVATTNQNKLAEFRRLLPDYEIVGLKLDIDEIQSLDPYKVATQKAIAAYRANGFNPVLIEETSLALRGLVIPDVRSVANVTDDVDLRLDFVARAG